MEEFSHFCDSWNQMKSNICNESFPQQNGDYSSKEMYSNRDQVKLVISTESEKSASGTQIVEKIKSRCNKNSQTTKRTRTNAEERKLVMTVYKNLLAGRCVETFGSGSVKRTSELTGLPLRSVYRIRNEELIACGSIELANTVADEDEQEEDVKHGPACEGTDKPSKGKATRQKRLSLIKKKIIFHVFDTLRSEQPDSSDSAVINITSEITGCPVRTIHRIRVEEKSEQGLQGPKVAKAKDAKKYKLSFKKYGDDIRLAIRSTIYEVQARTEFPIIKEIHDAVNERLNLSLSRSTLMRLIKHLGFFFVRKEGKKHILVEKSRDANKKPRKPKIKTNSCDPSKVESVAKKGKSSNGPLLPPDGFGDMFATAPSDYAFLDINKSYEVPPTGQYHAFPHQQTSDSCIQIPSMAIHTSASKSNTSSSTKPKRVLAKLNGEEVRTAIRTVIYDLKIKSVTPTISEIQQNVKGRFNMNLARTTLHRHIKRAGFVFKKKEGNKHVLVEKPLKRFKKPRKPRGTKDPSVPEVANKSKTPKKKEEQSRAAQSVEFIHVSPEFDSIAYDVTQYNSHEHKSDYMPLDSKQYNTLMPLAPDIAQAQHLQHRLQHQEMLTAHANQRLHALQQSNEMLRQMPSPLQPINVVQREVDVAHPRKLMTLSASKNCGLQWMN